MRIGLDARLYEGDPTGIGSYTRSQIDALARVDAGNLYVLFTHRPISCEPPGPNFRFRVIPWRNRITWTNLRLPRALAEERIDLYHGFANFEVPLRARCPRIATVHDVIPLRFPAWVPAKHRILFRLFMGPAVRACVKLVTGSRFSMREIVRSYGVPEDRIALVPFAPAPEFRVLADRSAVSRAAGLRGLDGPFFLFTGVLEPRKNMDGLIRAFAWVAKDAKDAGAGGRMRLVIAGSKGLLSEGLEKLAYDEGVGDSVLFPGFIPREELVLLMNAARAFVFPSFYEGFGMPALEAMACACPVIASDVTSLPEVCGGAAILVDPARPEAIASAMCEVLVDEALVARMRAKGREVAARSTWDDSARKLVRIYEAVFNS